MNYLQTRGVSLTSVYKYCIGYCDGSDRPAYRDRMVFPIHNHYGELLSMQGRAMYDWESVGGPKYFHGELPSKRSILYGLYQNAKAIVELGGVVIVEGPFDVIALDQCGIPAVALLGSSFSEDQTILLRRYTKSVVIWLDHDDAGVAATASIEAILSTTDMRVKEVNQDHNVFKDVSDMYVNCGIDTIKGCISNAS